MVESPLKLTNTLGQYDAYITVRGGGVSGQASAIRHGIAKSLLHLDETFRPVLKQAGFLRRDSRIKERKKYGAEESPQAFSILQTLAERMANPSAATRLHRWPAFGRA